MAEFRFEAQLWLYGGDAAWHFVTVPTDISDEIEATTTGAPRGFGSVRVRVTVGATSWATSVFPDSKRGAYVLPVKAEVRGREGLAVGTRAVFALELVDA